MDDTIERSLRSALKDSIDRVDNVYSVHDRSLKALSAAAGKDPDYFFIDRDFRGQSLAEIDVRGINLSGADLRGTNLKTSIIDQTTKLARARIDADDRHELLKIGIDSFLIEFTNEDLAQYMREKKEIPEEWANSITEINLSNFTIGNGWDVISCFANLEKFSCANSDFDDIYLLKDLTKLRFLELSHTKINDIDALVNMQQIEFLALTGVDVDDFLALSRLQAIRSLFLSETRFDDMSILSDMQGLTLLDISYSGVSSLEHLVNFQKIYRLDISGLPIYDSRSIIQMPNLHQLIMKDMDNSDLGFLSEMQRLVTLDIANNDIGSIDFVEGMYYLTDLNISGCSNLTYLPPHMPSKLRKITLASTSISDISVLSQCRHLEVIDISDSLVEALPYARWPHLRRIIASGSRIRGIDLMDLPSITALDISKTKVTHLKFLSHMPHLQELNAANTWIRTLRPLKSLRKLALLNVSGTLIRDIDPLSDLRKLSNVDVSGTKISSIEPVKEHADLISINIRGTLVDKLPIFHQGPTITIYADRYYEEEIASPLRNLQILQFEDARTSVDGDAGQREDS